MIIISIVAGIIPTQQLNAYYGVVVQQMYQKDREAYTLGDYGISYLNELEAILYKILSARNDITTQEILDAYRSL